MITKLDGMPDGGRRPSPPDCADTTAAVSARALAIPTARQLTRLLTSLPSYCRITQSPIPQSPNRSRNHQSPIPNESPICNRQSSID